MPLLLHRLGFSFFDLKQNVVQNHTKMRTNEQNRINFQTLFNLIASFSFSSFENVRPSAPECGQTWDRMCTLASCPLLYLKQIFWNNFRAKKNWNLNDFLVKIENFDAIWTVFGNVFWQRCSNFESGGVPEIFLWNFFFYSKWYNSRHKNKLSKPKFAKSWFWSTKKIFVATFGV